MAHLALVASTAAQVDPFEIEAIGLAGKAIIGLSANVAFGQFGALAGR